MGLAHDELPIELGIFLVEQETHDLKSQLHHQIP